MDTHKNSTRAGRSIDNLDDRKNAVTTDPGQGSRHGRETPRYKDEILEDEEKAALDHVQVSGVGDVSQDGTITGEDGRPLKPRSA
jgi:hypothetical protein